jgi:hypothetical protein
VLTLDRDQLIGNILGTDHAHASRAAAPPDANRILEDSPHRDGLRKVYNLHFRSAGRQLVLLTLTLFAAYRRRTWSSAR